MSRTVCYFTNHTVWNILIVPHDKHPKGIRGTDWRNTVPPPGTTIASGKKITIGSMGDPNDGAESDHWGWIYVNVDRPGSPQELQLYLRLSGPDGILDTRWGPYNPRSTKKDPMPDGSFGSGYWSRKGGPVYYNIRVDFDASRWMQDGRRVFGGIALNNLCITGSHDSGMSLVQSPTSGSNNCNTRTQTYPVLAQLEFGVRYFDIRPIIGSGKYYSGHYSQILGASWQGGRGQCIDEIIDQINTFTTNRGELIILNLSHDYNTDVGNFSYRHFNQDEWNGLFNKLLRINSRFIAKSQLTSLTRCSLDYFIGRGNSAVVVVVHPDKNIPLSLGEYARQGFYLSSAFDVYDCFSDTNDLNTMISKQIDKMKTQRNKDQYFLLSWTLTLSALQSIACVVDYPVIPFQALPTSIIDLANQANGVLAADLAVHLAAKLYPNILYTDNITDSTSAQIAMDINEFLVARSGSTRR